MHGRGGTGVKLAARIVGRTAFLAGFHVQDSPLYGAERRGAPVMAFVRFSRDPIHERGYVERPDVLVVADASQIAQPEAGILAGADRNTVTVVNSPVPAADLVARHGLPGRVITLDVSGIVLATVGRHVLSAAMAAATVRAMALAAWETVAEAIAVELRDSAVAAELVDRNLLAARRAFEAAPVVGIPTDARADAEVPRSPPVPFVVPRLPARVAAPAIVVPATSVHRTTEGWRLERPVVHRERCTRCLLCFVSCPEGAIGLDAEHWPVVDYAHCKGCGICIRECPTGTIEAVAEGSACAASS